MLKLAYAIGYKLAQMEEENPDASPADALAAALEKIPDVRPPHTSKDDRVQKPVGEPDDNDEYWGSPSTSFELDGLSHLGVTEQGPGATGI